ncbi:ABC transporter permease [Clostridium sp. 19966]|uniref:ABC transporter permease n=1 Tax=Clostridium sp. 19966 TaxID=2768166 RepID=UPI0028DF8184|nr:FtsX-like permease family protein [Clostridium sp. 19966]MDT8719435.1 ABC transporter permease [Clostridium sp. 19966]
MNNFIQLIPRYLMKNFKKTLVISISIIISVILLVTVKLTVNALNYNYERNAAKSANGIYHGKLQTSMDTDPIKKSNLVENSGECLQLGFKNFTDKKASLELDGFENNTYKLLNMSILMGRYPEKAGELAMEEWSLNKFFPSNKIGDEIVIDYEESIYNENGEVIGSKAHNGKWKLVGILNNSGQNDSNSLGRAIICMQEAKALKESRIVTTYFRVKDDRKPQQILENLNYSLQNENKKWKLEENETYLRSLKLENSIATIGIFLMLVVDVAAAAVIYNIFYITVLERIKEFSMLRAIGASMSQIKFLVLGEAILLSIICIPIALIIGGFGGRILFYYLISRDKDMLRSIISQKDIFQIGLAAFVAIIFSALSPASFSKKVSPIDGIKENYKDIARTKKHSIIDVFRIMNFTTSMAYINLKKSKKRLAATILSLAISMILIITSLYLLSLFDPTSEAKRYTGGDLLLNIKTLTGLRENYAYNAEDMNKIKALDAIKNINKHKRRTLSINVEGGFLTAQGKLKADTFQDNGITKMDAVFYGVDSFELEGFKKYLKAGNLDTKTFEEKPELIAIENLHYKEYTKFRIGENLVVGGVYQDKQGSEWKVFNNVNFNVMATLSTTPIRPIDDEASFIFICSNDALERYFGIKDYEQINIDANPKTQIDALKDKLSSIAKNKNGGSIITINDEINNMNKLVIVTRFILYGFSAILSFVSLINIYNTISISIVMRKREFGVLRAVGMTRLETMVMIFKEGSIYGIISSAFGSLLGGISSYIVYEALRADFLEGAVFRLPILLILLVAIITIIITTFISVPATRKATKFSIVESIKAIE